MFHSEYSSRHTRLRYQSVVSSLVFFLAVFLGIKSLSIPGFINFNETKEYDLAIFGIFLFALYSIVSFFIQDRVEKPSLRVRKKSLLSELDYIQKAFSSYLELNENLTRLVNTGRARINNAGTRKERFTVVKLPMSNSADNGWEESYFQTFENAVSAQYLAMDVKLASERINGRFLSLQDSVVTLSSRVEGISNDLTEIINIMNLIEFDVDGTQQMQKLQTLSSLGDHVMNLSLSGQDIVELLEEHIDTNIRIQGLHYWLLPFILPIVIASFFVLAGFIFWVKPTLPNLQALILTELTYV